MAIVVDIDDTVADFRTPFCDLIYHHTGVWQHWSQWENLDFKKVYPGIDFDYFKAIIDEQLLENLRLDDIGWPSVFKYAYSRWDVIVLSSRGYHPHGKAVTEKWLKDRDMPFTRVCIVNGYDKTTEIKQLGIKPRLLIDDHPEILTNFENHFPKAVVKMHRNYNKAVSVKYTARSSQDVLKILKKMID